MITSLATDRPRRFLFAMFQGGGNIPLILPVAARLVAHGHQVRVLAGPSVWVKGVPVSARLRERIAAAGAVLIPLQEADIHPFDVAPLRGLVRGWIPRALIDATDRSRPYRWAPVWARNVVAELERAPADVLVADFLLPGSLAGAEATGVPAAALVHGFYKHRPAPGLPPAGPGFLPAHGPLGRLRDAPYNAAIQRVYRRDALPYLNRARGQLGLSPLSSPFDQYDRAARVLILASAELDFPIHRLPSNVRYVGTPLDDKEAPAWNGPWPPDDPRPLVVVSLSTLGQGGAPVLQRVLTALAPLAVRALVTVGPFAAADFHVPPNTVLERFVPHASVLPWAAAMITHCGMGGMTKALAHGVPVVCLPLMADQPDNAARAVARGAGIRLKRDASPDQIRAALQHILAEPRFGTAARRLAAVLAREDGTEQAAWELESLGGRTQTLMPSAPGCRSTQ